MKFLQGIVPILMIVIGSVYCAPQWPGNIGGSICGGGGCSQPCSGFGCLQPQPQPPQPIPCGGGTCPIQMACGGNCPPPIQPPPIQPPLPCPSCQPQPLTGGCNLCYRGGSPSFCCPPFGSIGGVGGYGTAGGFGATGFVGGQVLGK